MVVIEACICGNELERRGEGPEPLRVRVSPCRCPLPGAGPGQVAFGMPDDVTAKQYAERKRAGLPLVADCERIDRWV